MKKKFTFLITALFALMLITLPMKVWAQNPTASFTVTGLSTLPSSFTSTPTGFTMSVANDGGNNNPALYSGSLRLYDHNQMTIASSNGTTKLKTVTLSMKINASKTGKYPGISAPSGSFSPSSVTMSTSSITWTAAGDGVATITFTFPQHSDGAGGNWTFSAVSLTYESGGGSTVATPSITGTDNKDYFVNTTNITLACETSGASIQYKLNDNGEWTNYTVPFGINATTTVYAKATKTGMTESTANKLFTKLSTISAARTQATGKVYTQGTITSVSGKDAFIQDNDAAICVRGDANITQSVGDNIRVYGTLGSYGGLLQIQSPVIEVVSTGNTVAPTEMTIAQVNASNNQGWFVKIIGATVGTTTNNNTTLTQNANSIVARNLDLTDISVGDVINLTGNISVYNTTKQIANPLVVVSPILEAAPASLSFTYVQGGNAAAQNLTISGDNLEDDITITLAGANFAISEDGSDWSNTVLTIAQADANGEIYVRFNSGLPVANNYSGTITLSSTNADNVVVNLTGSVTNQTYAINIATPITGGEVTSDVAVAEANATVTLTANPADAYTFNNIAANWSVMNGETPVTVTPVANSNDATFTMPAAAVNVTATFTAKPTYAITATVDPDNSGTIVTENSAWEGREVEVQVAAEVGYLFSSIAVYKTGDESTTVVYAGNATDGFTFDMPAYPVTVKATFISTTFAGEFEPYTGDIVEGDYVIYGGTNGAMKNVITSNRFENQGVTFDESNIKDPDIAAVWHISQISGTNYWAIYNAAANKYAGGTNSKNQGALYNDTISNNNSNNLARWTIGYNNECYTFTNYGRTQASSDAGNAYLRQNGSSGWGTYSENYGNAPQLYKYKQPVAPTWTSFPTAENLITGQNYELTVTNYVSGYPTPTIALNTVVSSSLYEFENGLFMFSSNAIGDYAFTFTATNSAGSANVTLTITVNAPASVNYYYSNNGVLGAAQSITQGQSATLAAGSNLNDDFVFVGWTTDASDVDNVLAAGSQQTINAETTFYAVYSNTVSVTETKVAVLDGSELTSTATTEPSSYTNNGITYALSEGAKQQSSSGENRFADKAILIGKNGAYIYNTQDAFGQGITKFEVYANAGASTKVSVGINFSTTSISAYNAEAANTWTETLSTVDHVYDASSALPTGAKYFWYQVTNANNSQIQFRITYTKTTNVTTKYTRVYPANTTATDDITITGPTVITSGSVLDMGSYTLTNTDPANLIIEDGGQLITSNAVAATVKKNVEKANNWGAGEYTPDGWYFIALPLNSDEVTPSMLTTGDYDLYHLNPGTATWENYKTEEGNDNPGFKLANGEAYLYANSAGFTANFEGVVKAAAATENVTVYNGWNLIGNPFTYNAYLNRPYYKMNEERTGVELVEDYYDNDNFIAPCTGVVIKSTATTSETVTFSQTPAELSANHGNINIALAQTEATRGVESMATLDKAILSFNEGSELGKFYFGTQNANIYIPMDNEQYAIVSAEPRGEMPVCFKAAQDGQYTITVNPEEVEMGYLHLIDNISGTDIDLLATPSYTFNAKADDYESRFRLVFSANSDINANLGDDFAFISNGQLIVTGEGTLQVVDMMGRVISTEIVKGTSSKAINAKAGVYVLQLIDGENVKTQKIVVR